MTEQGLITALNDTEAERVRWMTAALTAGNEITALKAQVNCLRMRVANGMDVIANEYPEDQWDYYGYSDMRKALEATPEQCLAEVKAKAIEEYKQEHNTKIGSSR